MHRIKFALKVLSPVVLSSASNSTVMTETHSAFGGSIIRGVLATRFVEVQNLTDEAHDKTFREIFFGGLKFLPANPETRRERSIVLPVSLQSGKKGTDDANKVQDLLADGKSRPGYKSLRGLGVLAGKEFIESQVNTNMFMHMSRSGEAERLAGKSIGGQIYNYEAIDVGQKFSGEIVGEEKILRKLRNGLGLTNGKFTAYVGRSRFTQYGKCLLTLGGIEKIKAAKFTDKIYLRLDTPLIPLNDCFLSAREVLTEEVVDKLGEKFSLGKVFASSVEVENFVVPWRMKRPRVSALAAGSVFELTAAGLTDADKKLLNEKIYEGFGLRTEEGFGQLRLWTPAEDFTLGERGEEEISKPKNFSDDTIKLAKKILKARLLEQVRIYAHEDAKKLGTQLEEDNTSHFFARLDVILSNVAKENLRDKFKEQLEREIREGSLFYEHLKNFYMGGHSFHDVLTGVEKFPRSVDEVLNLSEFADVCKAINFSKEDFTDDEFLREYLEHYFRFARKVAVTSKGGKRVG